VYRVLLGSLLYCKLPYPATTTLDHVKMSVSYPHSLLSFLLRLALYRVMLLCLHLWHRPHAGLHPHVCVLQVFRSGVLHHDRHYRGNTACGGLHLSAAPQVGLLLLLLITPRSNCIARLLACLSIMEISKRNFGLCVPLAVVRLA